MVWVVAACCFLKILEIQTFLLDSKGTKRVCLLNQLLWSPFFKLCTYHNQNQFSLHQLLLRIIWTKKSNGYTLIPISQPFHWCYTHSLFKSVSYLIRFWNLSISTQSMEKSGIVYFLMLYHSVQLGDPWSALANIIVKYDIDLPVIRNLKASPKTIKGWFHSNVWYCRNLTRKAKSRKKIG